MTHDNLKEYRKKRDVKQSGEPKGNSSGKAGKTTFVIQKHDASQLHYDFRLEMDGALKSWAIPKGPSTDPSEKRLAVEVEDHPLDYANFEGVIPKEEYGGGTVMVWDRGTYRNLREEGNKSTSMQQAYEKGLIEVWLDGEKLHGGYALKRFREGKKPQWLLIKMDDEGADARRDPTSTENESVKTGRDMKTIAEEESS
ncbi:DNA polymerase ligase N-terminal domain-containing protein [Marinobacter fonticola]|uniref:DNA polymerase ligase N-terminal domain-containing protein n=1 Tax=Marinobacter fonticola TaxID=2603215 RepID=UPI0011E7F1A9